MKNLISTLLILVTTAILLSALSGTGYAAGSISGTGKEGVRLAVEAVGALLG